MNFREYTKIIDCNKDILIIYFTNKLFTILNDNVKSIKNENVKSIKNDNILTIDIDDSLELINKINLKSVPFFLVYKDSQIIEEIFGNYNNIKEIIKIHL